MSEEPTVLTGEQIPIYRLLTARRDMILKIDTGMSLTRTASGLQVAQRDGITTKRTNRGALRDLNAYLKSRGVEPKWSRTYPQG